MHAHIHNIHTHIHKHLQSDEQTHKHNLTHDARNQRVGADAPNGQITAALDATIQRKRKLGKVKSFETHGVCDGQGPVHTAVVFAVFVGVAAAADEPIGVPDLSLDYV